MGFPLPIYGYVAQRGHYDLHDSHDRLGAWNARNIASVEAFMDGLREVYPQCPAPGKFVFPWGSDDPLIFGDVEFEIDNDERPILHRLLHRLKGGGTIVVTDLEHLIAADQENALQLMLDYNGSKTAFLDINQSPVALVRNTSHVDRLISHMMDNRTGVRNLVRRRARAFDLRPREVRAPEVHEIA